MADLSIENRVTRLVKVITEYDLFRELITRKIKAEPARYGMGSRESSLMESTDLELSVRNDGIEVVVPIRYDCETIYRNMFVPWEDVTNGY